MPQKTVCPSCAEPLDPDDAYCGLCGLNLHEPPPVQTGAPAPQGSAAAPGVTGDFVLAAPELLLLDERDESDEPEVRTSRTAPAAVPEAPVTGPRCVHCGSGPVAVDGYCEACGGVQPRPRDHTERSLDGVAGVSDRGIRHHRNEDAFVVAATSLPDGASAVVAVVCDGVSSATRPDEASLVAAESGSEYLLTALEQGVEPVRAMHEAIVAAARAVEALAYDGTGPAPDERGHNSPACTCVSAIATGGAVTIGWIGDSRAYWVPDDREGAEPYRLTEDDSWAARMVEAGLMGEAEAYADPRAHAITGWLGADAGEVDPHTVTFTPHVPGVLLVCTDGLWNYAEAATDLADVVPRTARTEPLAAAQELVKYALAAGGHDNITVAVLPFPPAPARVPDESSAEDESADPDRAEEIETLVDLPVLTQQQIGTGGAGQRTPAPGTPAPGSFAPAGTPGTAGPAPLAPFAPPAPPTTLTPPNAPAAPPAPGAQLPRVAPATPGSLVPPLLPPPPRHQPPQTPPPPQQAPENQSRP